jgi:hypothetical protein
MTGTPGWSWAAAVAVILGLLAVDLALGRGRPTMRRAVLVSAGWVAAAVAFGGVLLAWRGGAAGQEYFTAYLVEKALSIDNVFVFALLFQAFAVPVAYQHRVLFAGVLGALVLRAGFIAAGAMTRSGYLTQGLTALLAFIGVKMLLADVLHIPATMSLGVIVAIIATAVLLSAWQRRRQAPPAARPHDLHTGCALPAPRPDVLETSTRQVATEGGHPDAAPSAEATARPAVTAVAK